MSVTTAVATAMTVVVVSVAATMTVVVMPVSAAMTVIVVTGIMATAMAMVVMTGAMTMIFMTAAMMIAGSMVAGASREHAATGIRRARPVRDQRFHKEQHTDGDGESQKECGNETPVLGILIRRQMQRRVVIHHRRKNERDEVHEDGADRRRHERVPVRNAP